MTGESANYPISSTIDRTARIDQFRHLSAGARGRRARQARGMDCPGPAGV